MCSTVVPLSFWKAWRGGGQGIRGGGAKRCRESDAISDGDHSGDATAPSMWD